MPSRTHLESEQHPTSLVVAPALELDPAEIALVGAAPGSHLAASYARVAASSPKVEIAPDIEIDRRRKSAAAGEINTEFPWGQLVDKMTQTALLLVLTKLIASWAIVAIWGVEMSSRLIWGFIPYAGLETSGANFRTVAAWSTATVAAMAVLWTLAHFIRRHRSHPVRTWAAAASIPMAGLLTSFEWMRRFDADHLIPTEWLVRILLVLAVAGVLFLGFIEHPNKTATKARTPDTSTNPQRSPMPRISAQP